MIDILGRIPKYEFYVACSGGTDSMVLVDFLMKNPKNRFELLHFNHGTEHCDEAEKFVVEFAKKNRLVVHVGRINRERGKGESQEEYWRNCRYAFLSRFSSKPILMAHHLNDVIETWIMSSMRGKPMVIPYHNPKYNIYRPFLIVPKSKIEEWTKFHNVKSVYDGSNSDTALMRNYIRHNMVNHAYHINPGIEKTLTKIVKDEFAKAIDFAKALN